jgi:hypothetical protein
MGEAKRRVQMKPPTGEGVERVGEVVFGFEPDYDAGVIRFMCGDTSGEKGRFYFSRPAGDVRQMAEAIIAWTDLMFSRGVPSEGSWDYDAEPHG